MDAVMVPDRFRHVVFVDASSPAAGGAVFHRPAGIPPRTFQSAERLRSDEPTPSLAEERFLRLVFGRAGLDLDAYRSGSVCRRVPACLRALRVRTPEQGIAALERDPRLLPPALGALLIGVTGPFRDRAVFASLSERVMPALSAARQRGRRLRVWSAACSDGAELYSVAMLLAASGLLAHCDLLGTDVRPDALGRAAAGVLGPEAGDDVPGPLRRRFVDPAGTRVALALRAAARWKRSDLLSAAEPGPWDLILCRNVGMYFTADAAAALYRRVGAELSPGGFLVLGRAERPLGAGDWRAVGPCVYQRGTVPDRSRPRFIASAEGAWKL